MATTTTTTTTTGILRHTPSWERQRPLPRFTQSDKSLTQTPSLPLRKDSVPPTRRRRKRNSSDLYTIPAIMAHLTRKYSEEQLNKVPPVFMPSVRTGTTSLAEPYEVTLKNAVKLYGESVLIKRPVKECVDQPRRKSPPKVTFAL